jgi:DNA-binding transcriptional regulator YiaG
MGEEEMNRCYQCSYRGELSEQAVTHLLDGLFEVEATKSVCPQCGAEYTGFSTMEPMYEAIAQDLALETRRLLPPELRWLRKYLGFSSDAFAEYLGVTRQTVSRWENEGGLPVATERLIKVLAKSGPIIEAYPLEERPRSTPRYHQNSVGNWVRV